MPAGDDRAEIGALGLASTLAGMAVGYASVVAGLVPARMASRIDIAAAIKSE